MVFLPSSYRSMDFWTDDSHRWTSFCLLHTKTMQPGEFAKDSLWSTKPLQNLSATHTSYTNDYSSTTFFSTISSLLTLFSKFFSPFLRSTCSLSVSHKYLALEEVYLPFRAAIPNNPTLWKHSLDLWVADYGVFTLYDVLFQGTYATHSHFRTPPLDYNSITSWYGFSLWAFACSLAATGAILVSFFSSAYWYA